MPLRSATYSKGFFFIFAMHVGEGLYALEGRAGADGERVQLGSVLPGKMESTIQLSRAHTVISSAISKG